ncbi:CaiB/BaiF CoA transferase family protein [Streptomyces sp. H27-D2]|uniref:CaiB/BaiF CoA transferase family protein n=1 Tax=Streptomyces sp. H27-D2 TaxID=3046304 RepID=UPI002DBC240E|nr:CaiB/BaiF CoA-transferase family protein [Streptomyces sp. H27-D2]MEC4017655.1 CaiB/BaiF CoA-transferase family protein [Streptomyces sp. H27-D2]
MCGTHRSGGPTVAARTPAGTGEPAMTGERVTGPLDGLKVLELAAIGPAPFACMMLADLGADVLRVDRADGRRSFEGWHRVLDRGRRTVRLDLKDPAGAAELLRLAAESDVLVEGFRPGVAERLGIGPQEFRERNPALVYARMTGWGQEGPLAQSPGHDINYLALTGALDAIGAADGPPVPPLNLLGDFGGGGMLLVSGVLAALFERQRSGLGQVVDAAIVDGAGAMLGMLTAMTDAGDWQPRRGANLLDGGAPFYRCYVCADGRHVAVGALEEAFYAALLDGLGLDPAALPDRGEPANWPALRAVFAERFAGRDRDVWAEVFASTDACVSPVLSLAEAAGHPHHRARGSGPAVPAPRFSRMPVRVPVR